MTVSHRILIYALLVTLVGITFSSLVQWKIIENNLRYFRSDREAIAFNQLVEVARGSVFDAILPSGAGIDVLLRVPSVKVSEVWASLRGEMVDLSEFQTRDPSGPRGFSTSVSHPTVLLCTRLFSVAVTIGVVLMVFIISIQLRQGPGYGFVGALVALLSPQVLKISYAATSEIVTMGLCLLCSCLGLAAINQRVVFYFIASALVSGLATGSQHSVASVGLVPLIGWLVGGRSAVTLVAGVVACFVGFCVASPFPEAQFKGFFELVLEEARFGWLSPVRGGLLEVVAERSTVFLGWLLLEGVGIASGGLAVTSLVYFVKCMDGRLACFLSFPLSYFTLLILNQKTGLHELVMIVPYIGVMTACGLQRFSRVSQHPTVKTAALPAFGSLITLQLGAMSYLYLQTEISLDPRDQAALWLANENRSRSDVAIEKTLHMSNTYELQGASTVDLSSVSAPRLVQDGYKFLVAPSNAPLSGDGALVEELRRFARGSAGVDSSSTPEIVVYRLRDDDLAQVAKRAPAALLLRPSEMDASCVSEHEQFCWTSARRTVVRVEGPSNHKRQARIKIRNPWEAEIIEISSVFGTELARAVLKRGDEWVDLTFELPKRADSFVVTLSDVHDRHRTGLSGGVRRVGIAIKNMTLNEIDENDTRSFLEGYPETVQSAIREVFANHERESLVLLQVQSPHQARGDVVSERGSGGPDSVSSQRVSEQDQDKQLLRSRAQQVRKTFIDSILAAEVEAPVDLAK